MLKTAAYAGPVSKGPLAPLTIHRREPGPTTAAESGGAEQSGSLAQDRIYSRGRFLWIRPGRGRRRAWLGYLSLGDSVRVRGGDPAQARVPNGIGDGDRCRIWYAIEPRGYVCTGLDATLGTDDPLVVELAKSAADRRSPWPYQYGESLGTPVYPSVPDEPVAGRSILLVDDIYTSGSTVNECSRVLISAGARHVDVLTLARVA